LKNQRLEFDDLDALMTAAEAREFDELLEEAFEQMFNPDSQIEAYDMFPFYAISTATERENSTLTRQKREEVYTYDIRFDLDNFHELADALNDANPDVSTFRAADLALVADEFGDALESLDITVDVTESKELLGLDINFSETETTSFGTSQVALTFKVVNRPGEGTKQSNFYCIDYQLENQSRGNYYMVDQNGARYSNTPCADFGPAEEVEDNAAAKVFRSDSQSSVIPEVTYEDYVLGDEDADTNLIAYVDLQCPFI